MSEQPAPDLHDLIRRVVVQLFPWAAYLYTDASKDFTIRSASTKIHLAGDAQDPPVARKGDATDGGGLAFFPGVPGTTPPSLWYTADRAAPYTWAVVEPCLITGPLPTDEGTRVAGVITAGSARVTCK